MIHWLVGIEGRAKLLIGLPFHQASHFGARGPAPWQLNPSSCRCSLPCAHRTRFIEIDRRFRATKLTAQ